MDEAIHVAMGDERMECASFNSFSPCNRASGSCFVLCVARSVLFSLNLLTPLIGSTMVLLCRQGGAVVYDVSNACAIHALHAASVVSRHLHGDAAA